MGKASAILGVHLLDAKLGPVKVGTLTRDADGAVAFTVSESYLRDTARPVLSLGWYDPTSDAGTRDRLSARGDKIGLHGSIPPWFAGLLPEGALRELVLTEMGPGDHDQFDVLTRLGADLPGAVLVTAETDTPASAGPLDLISIKGFKAAEPKGVVKFSLAGVQLKFTANIDGERLTLPARGDTGRCIIKVASDTYRGLPEAEHGAMTLAGMIGVETAPCRLMPRAAVAGIPDEMLEHGEQVLVVDRFDRAADDTRIHIEDAGQVIGAIGDRKYTMATTETVINMISRFSTDRRADILEAIRRIVADVLIGNGDNHLKNWSFRFPEPGQVRLSPAYDIVPTVLFQPRDTLALRFVRTHSFDTVNLHRFERVASFLRVDPKWVVREVKATVERALDTWPATAPELLGERWSGTLLARLNTLALVQEVRGSAKIPIGS
ncbi:MULTISPECIES: type II toxin-antitoxin system HipA family toxin [Sphingobium]|jgi:serine/threonine-protein kinase HipA|uniref:Type II toxin-antitoxin system HipA family toxin n=1 Tax=Sphingobium fuliginis (strain ATCC 27551) TaxID=336203 RepID=A0A7M2GDJ7_SPHSA|nr:MULTISPECIES: type II toxin-antitoxin system HipA family toxin [Sphingobium]MCB4861168.1 type II toxin-antitoxin system HipA family toxin [Sphingobium sp. PNB]PNP93506.1 phosphatidylinositol kinase [Sphingobium sp. SA916]QOT70633.1 type II toxin-antitoxin system HipA family toxin [Sphingobium fuliginis]UXC89699.1 type II toxin-antitoxin system HipA family toxin [Sphingobium sp. RSMS]